MRQRCSTRSCACVKQCARMCPAVQSQPPPGLPVSLGTWQEMLGTTQVGLQASCGIQCAWGGWMRNPTERI